MGGLENGFYPSFHLSLIGDEISRMFDDLGGEAIHYPSDSGGWRGKGEISHSGRDGISSGGEKNKRRI